MPHPGEETRHVLPSQSLPHGSPSSSAHPWGPHRGRGPQAQRCCRRWGFLLGWGAHISTDPHVTSLLGSGRGHGGSGPRGEIQENREGNTAPLLAPDMGSLSITTCMNFSILLWHCPPPPFLGHPRESLLAPRCPLFLGQSRPPCFGSCL